MNVARKAHRRTGRPPLPTDAARRNRVVTMVTDSEFEHLQASAQADGTTISTSVHEALRRFLDSKPPR